MNKFEEAQDEIPPKRDTPFDDRYISEFVFRNQDAIREALSIAAAVEKHMPALNKLIASQYEIDAINDYNHTDQCVDRHNEEGIISLAEKAANSRHIIKDILGAMKDD